MKMTFTQLVEHIEHAKDMPPELYHGTSIFNLYYILQSNKLVAGAHWGKPGEPHGPRLTKDPTVAMEFFSYATPDLENAYTTSIRITAQHAEAVLTDDVLELAVNWPYLEVESIEQARELMRQVLHHPEVTIV